MPLHRLFVPYVPHNLYSAEDKLAMAETITKVYGHLPPFYVVMVFVNFDSEDYYVGGLKSLSWTATRGFCKNSRAVYCSTIFQVSISGSLGGGS